MPQGLPEAERKRGLLELAERAITRGAGSTWVVATHCELCRPMLTVGAAAVLDALAAGLAAAAAPGAADPLVASIVLVAQLAALLRLDEVRRLFSLLSCLSTLFTAGCGLLPGRAFP